ncbi:hypothetical protein [Paludisphaera sp.]|uniref:hypothetical protein n=1 Tax=Paludisphaera sp. TaxID=2017432 RepID=UPI00301D351A
MLAAFNLTYPLPVDINGTSLRDRSIDHISGYPYFDIDLNRCSTTRGAASNSLRRIFESNMVYSISVTRIHSILIEFDSPPVTAIEAGKEISLGISSDGSLVAVEFTNPGGKALESLRKFRR